MKRKLRVVSIKITLLLSILCIGTTTLFAKSPQKSQPALIIAVASNFYFPLSRLIEQSDYWAKQPIKLVTASSGTLYAQITKGAPFDVFFSADTKRPQSLETQLLAYERQTYAIGKLVLWPVPEELSQKPYTRNSISLTGKLAIANPQLAPFGAAAEAYIATLQNAESITKHLVLGASVSQAFQFVDSGNAQFGLLAESTLIQASHTLSGAKYSHYGLIPFNAYPSITQQVVIVKQSKNKAVAQSFINFVLSKPSQFQLSHLGYLPLTTLNMELAK